MFPEAAKEAALEHAPSLGFDDSNLLDGDDLFEPQDTEGAAAGAPLAALLSMPTSAVVMISMLRDVSGGP